MAWSDALNYWGQFSRTCRVLEKGSCAEENDRFCFLTAGVSCLLGAGTECSYEADLGNFSLTRCV